MELSAMSAAMPRSLLLEVKAFFIVKHNKHVTQQESLTVQSCPYVNICSKEH